MRWLLETIRSSMCKAYTWATLFCFMLATDQAHASVLSGLKSRLDSVGTELIAIGGSVTLVGFVWALLSMLIGLAGAAKAIVILVIGIAISFAKPIVDMIAPN